MNGPHSMIEDLLQTQGKRLHAILFRLTLSVQTADDLLQELCVRLLASDGLARAQSPVGYAIRTAVHLGLEWRRRRRPPGDDSLQAVQAAHDGPLQLACRREEIERLLDAVQRLREPLRQVIVLRFIEGERYEEIGVVMGKTAQQVRGLAHKGIRTLRQELENLQDEALHNA